MIARQIRENGRGKTAAPKAIERQGMRAAFENGMSASSSNDLREKTLQVERLGRGGFRWIGFQRSAVFDGAEEAAAQTGGVNDGIEQKARGGLAVGSGDSDKLQLFCGMLVKVCGNNRECFARIRHLHPRHRSCDYGQRCLLALPAPYLAALYVRGCLANDGACSALHSSGDAPST